MPTVARSSRTSRSPLAASIRRFQSSQIHEPAQQHHRAGDGNRESEDDRALDDHPQLRPSSSRRPWQCPSESARRNRDVTNAPQIPKEEMQADPEHQQDDAEFGQLLD